MDTLLEIAPGPSRIVRSSALLPWRGLLMEKHSTSPGVRSGAVANRHVITLLRGPSARFEYFPGSGRPAFQTKAPGAVTILPFGPIPDVRLHSAAEFIHCAFDEEFMARVVAETNSPSAPVFRAGIKDATIERLMNLLLEELDAPVPSGTLYVESLAYALAARFLLVEGGSEVRVSPLPLRTLNRVREKMEANLEADLSLTTLAEESGYSREHFLRMFRVATGLTPHQYVLNLRLTHAQQWLKRRGASLIDIAASCGFASQSHMTSVFRKRLGVTPAEFRRSFS